MDKLVTEWLGQDKDEETRAVIQGLWERQNLEELEARLATRTLIAAILSPNETINVNRAMQRFFHCSMVPISPVVSPEDKSFFSS